MQVPPDIVIRGIQRTPAIEGLIDQGIAGLEQACDYIISARIAVERAQKRHRVGNLYRTRIDVRLPGRTEVIVKRWSKGLKKNARMLADAEEQLAFSGEVQPKKLDVVPRRLVRRKAVREEPVIAMLRRAFDAARLELESVVERQRGDVKRPAQQGQTAIIERIRRDEGYGFLRTLDGEEVYFHQNSVLHGHWKRLKVGAAVRYAAEIGEKGLQATTVEPVQVRGALEAHDELHELPSVAPRRKRR